MTSLLRGGVGKGGEVEGGGTVRGFFGEIHGFQGGRRKDQSSLTECKGGL